MKKIVRTELRGGATLADLIVVVGIIGRMGRTQAGKPVYDEIIASDRSYGLVVRRGNRFGNAFDPESNTLYIDPERADDIIYKGKDGKGHRMGLLRAVAHEASHVIVNYKNNPGLKGEQMVVDKYENPISSELGDNRDRGNYQDTLRLSQLWHFFRMISRG